MFSEIKKNIIDNFLNKYYRFTCISDKGMIFSDLEKRCPFPFISNNECTEIKMNLGNGISIDIYFDWEYREYDQTYILKNIH